MPAQPDSDAQALQQWLQLHEQRDLLRLITCGSVDDGKSTLIGRLLHDTQRLRDDQIATLANTRAPGDAEPDYSRLLDGLGAEREQGITIDVAYRYVDTERRKFIIADCPGHAQYTRNMATGASTAQLAIVLVDARHGLLTQTRRHSYILALLGVPQVLLAVNKMDLVDHDQAVFERIAAEYRALAAQLGLDAVTCIPISALHGENLTQPSAAMPWYHGPTLLQHLETVPAAQADASGPLRLPVQRISRDGDARALEGTLASGSVQPGDAVVVLPSGQRSRVRSIRVAGAEQPLAQRGQAVTVALDDTLDVGRGDLLVAADAVPALADQFAVQLLWMDTEPLLPGRLYWLRIGTRTVTAQITQIRYRVDVNTQEHLAARQLELNEVAVCHLHLDEPIAFEPYAHNRELGGFILIDRQTRATAAAGRIDFALHRASNLHWQPLDVDKAARARQKRQQPRCLWFTGLSGAGKSTIANALERKLLAQGFHTYLLDGDNVRHGLNKDLGFTDADRVENIRRVAEVARLMVDAGLIVLVSFISPFAAERRMARDLFADGEFVEIHVDTPLAVAERRDVKGLYAKARAGQLRNFTGLDSPYEVPENPELRLDTTMASADALVEVVVAWLQGNAASP